MLFPSTSDARTITNVTFIRPSWHLFDQPRCRNQSTAAIKERGVELRSFDTKDSQDALVSALKDVDVLILRNWTVGATRTDSVGDSSQDSWSQTFCSLRIYHGHACWCAQHSRPEGRSLQSYETPPPSVHDHRCWLVVSDLIPCTALR